MASSVVRASSGQQIVVRTGVVSGVGPSGPRGSVGPAGAQGDTGPQGVPGPMGQINDFYTKVSSVGSSQSVGSTTWTAMSFGTVVVDQLSAVASVTNIALPVGMWWVHAYVKFYKPSNAAGSGARMAEVRYDGNTVESVIQQAVTDYDTDLGITAFVPATSAARILSIRLFHSQSVAIPAEGHLTISRLGPGATGPAGPQGVPGPVGQQGPTGPTGPAGSLVNNNTTFADIGGTN